MSTLNPGKIGLGRPRPGGLYPHWRLSPWLVTAAVMIVVGALVVVIVAAAGPPSGTLDLPLPQPAPVGP